MKIVEINIKRTRTNIILSFIKSEYGTRFFLASSIVVINIPSSVVCLYVFVSYWCTSFRFGIIVSCASTWECSLHARFNFIIEFATYGCTSTNGTTDATSANMGDLWGSGILHKCNLNFLLSSGAETWKHTVVRVVVASIAVLRLLLHLLHWAIVTFHAWCMTFIASSARISLRWGIGYILLRMYFEVVRVHWRLCSRWICLYSVLTCYWTFTHDCVTTCRYKCSL